MISIIKEIHLNPNEIIYRQNDKDLDDNSIYFIEKGNVELCM